MDVKIYPSNINGVCFAPASKSYAQRAFVTALLSNGVTVLNNVDMCDDIEAVMGVIKDLGADVTTNKRSITISSNGITKHAGEINIGESGLATRLFAPVVSLAEKPITITGHGSIMKRPITMMEEPLKHLGAEVKSNNGFLPVTIKGRMIGGEVAVDGSISSQFLSGLLISLPTIDNNSVLKVESLKSKPYIDMTLEVIKAFGVEVENKNYEEFFIKGGQKYTPSKYNIEGDWSGASALLVAGAVAGSITVKNLNPRSLQADKAIINALQYAGALISIDDNGITVSRPNKLEGFSFDATDCPDLFPALVALAANCTGESTLVGTKRLTHKESNRATTLADIYQKMGIEIDLSYENVMIVKGSAIKGGVELSSHSDHRIAMSAAVAGLNASRPITITSAEAVGKSFPLFWNVFSDLQKGV